MENNSTSNGLSHIKYASNRVNRTGVMVFDDDRMVLPIGPVTQPLWELYSVQI